MKKKTFLKDWSEDMGEISGFGGSYENSCRAMVLAGIGWIDAHPNADPQFKGYKGLYGVVLEENDDAKALTEAIMNAETALEDGTIVRIGDGATGAMHQAAISHVLAYKKLGWEEYCRQLKERDKDED